MCMVARAHVFKHMFMGSWASGHPETLYFGSLLDQGVTVTASSGCSAQTGRDLVTCSMRILVDSSHGLNGNFCYALKCLLKMTYFMILLSSFWQLWGFEAAYVLACQGFVCVLIFFGAPACVSALECMWGDVNVCVLASCGISEMSSGVCSFPMIKERNHLGYQESLLWIFRHVCIKHSE